MNFISDEITMDIRKNLDSFYYLPRYVDEERKFQLVLTDPPYNLNVSAKWDLHRLFCQLATGTIIVFSPPENQWVESQCEYLFWEKPISTKNTSQHYSRFIEMIFVYRLARHKFNQNRHWSQYTNVFKDLVDNSDLHPFRKPPSLIERLILNHTDPGDWILDPFAGSFVVADVAKRLGRNCISIEIDNELYEKYGKQNSEV